MDHTSVVVAPPSTPVIPTPANVHFPMVSDIWQVVLRYLNVVYHQRLRLTEKMATGFVTKLGCTYQEIEFTNDCTSARMKMHKGGWQINPNQLFDFQNFQSVFGVSVTMLTIHGVFISVNSWADARKSIGYFSEDDISVIMTTFITSLPALRYLECEAEVFRYYNPKLLADGKCIPVRTLVLNNDSPGKRVWEPLNWPIQFPKLEKIVSHIDGQRAFEPFQENDSPWRELDLFTLVDYSSCRITDLTIIPIMSSGVFYLDPMPVIIHQLVTNKVKLTSLKRLAIRPLVNNQLNQVDLYTFIEYLEQLIEENPDLHELELWGATLHWQQLLLRLTKKIVNFVVKLEESSNEHAAATLVCMVEYCRIKGIRAQLTTGYRDFDYIYQTDSASSSGSIGETTAIL